MARPTRRASAREDKPVTFEDLGTVGPLEALVATLRELRPRARDERPS